MRKMICLVTLSSFLLVSCASTWNYRWESGSPESATRKTGRERRDRSLTFSVHSAEARLDAKMLVVPITRNVEEQVLQQAITELSRTDRELRWRENQKEKTGNAATGIGVLAGLGIGIIVGLTTVDTDSKNDANILAVLGIITGFMLGGLLVGAAIGAGASAVASGGSSEYTGRTRDNVINSSESWKEVQSRIVAADEPATGVNVLVSSDDLYFTTSSGSSARSVSTATDRSGRVIVEIDHGPSNWDFSPADLRHLLPGIEPMKFVKDPTRATILSRIGNEIHPQAQSVRIETRASEDGTYTSIKNDWGQIRVDGYSIAPGAAYSALETFIDQEINSRIKRVTLELRDIDSRIPIQHSKFEGRIVGSSPRDLLFPYFQEPLMDWALERVGQYDVGPLTTYASDDGILILTVCVPSTIEVEITNPKYHFSTQSIAITGESLNKRIYMAELGAKMRVKIVDQ